MDNASGLVNVQDASNHGAAIIYGNNKNESAVDNYLDRVDRMRQQNARQQGLDQQQQSRDNAQILKEIGKVWSPYSQDVRKKYDEWQKLQGAALLSNDPKEKYDNQAAADMQMQDIITTVSIAEEQKRLSDITDRHIISNPEWFSQEEIDYHNKWKGRTDANSANERYEPILAKKQTKFGGILKAPGIKPLNFPTSKTAKIDGTDVKEYYDESRVTPQQLDDAYNAYSIVPDVKYAKSNFIDDQTKGGKSAAQADELFKNYLQQQWLSSMGITQAKKDDKGNIEYYYSEKLKYVGKENSPRSTTVGMDLNKYDYGYYNKSGNIELVRDDDGYIKPYYSGQTNDDFVEVAPSSIIPFVNGSEQAKDLGPATDKLRISVAKGIIENKDGSVWIDVNIEQPANGPYGFATHYGNKQIMIIDDKGKKTNAYNYASSLYHGAIKIANGKVVPDKGSAKLQGSRGFGEYDTPQAAPAPAAPAGGGQKKAAPAPAAPAGGGQKKAAPAPAAPAAPGSKPRRQVKVVNGKIVTVVNGKIVP